VIDGNCKEGRPEMGLKPPEIVLSHVADTVFLGYFCEIKVLWRKITVQFKELHLYGDRFQTDSMNFSIHVVFIRII
jgi:hypothetical protein